MPYSKVKIETVTVRSVAELKKIWMTRRQGMAWFLTRFELTGPITDSQLRKLPLALRKRLRIAPAGDSLTWLESLYALVDLRAA